MGEPDVYFRPEYGEAECTRLGYAQLSIRRLEGKFQLPLIIRPVTDRWSDAISPYGYSGAYAQPDLAPEEIDRAWTSVWEELRDHGVVSVFLRHSPLVAQATLPEPHVPIIRDHETVAVDLTDVDAAWSRLEGRCRTAIRKATKNSATVEIRSATAADLAAGSDFRALYEDTMRRREASAFYLFPDGYYQRLLAGLGPDLLLARGLDAEGAVLSAALFMRHDQFLHYHLSGSDPRANQLGLNNLLIWEAARHGADLGARLLHLGGGTRADDPLYRFKASFSPHRLTYAATGLIVDAPAYDTLREAARPRATSTSFFPAYRAGVHD